MEFNIKTNSRTDFIDITDQVQNFVSSTSVEDGICLVFVTHTTAAVTINENADPAVRTDLKAIFDRIIPWENNYHHMEGNSAAHMKTTITGSSEMIPIENGRLVLGTWQSVFFCEYDGPRRRKVVVKVIG
ncbi:MAG: YjbQ family protein [Desulfobacterales bacterium]|nr:YjbQ family protein [Desulfobacterales bacterium]MCP4160919.1 YjbQ family protein [Deltaproteobacteria bacterium]